MKTRYKTLIFFKLFLLFTIVPVIEIYFIIEIGSVIGTIPTIAIIIMSGLFGAYMARREGLSVIYEIQRAINQGRVPGSQILHGILILVGAVTLITPGFMTDLLGLSLIIPYSRRFYLKFLGRYISKIIQSHEIRIQ